MEKAEKVIVKMHWVSRIVGVLFCAFAVSVMAKVLIQWAMGKPIDAPILAGILFLGVPLIIIFLGVPSFFGYYPAAVMRFFPRWIALYFQQRAGQYAKGVVSSSLQMHTFSQYMAEVEKDYQQEQRKNPLNS